MEHNRLTTYIGIIFISLSILIIISSLTSADTINVNDDADPGWYDETHVQTITEGISNASEGDTVYIYSGTYNEAVVVNKTNLVLEGENKNTTILSLSGINNNDAIRVTNASVDIKKLTIKDIPNAQNYYGIRCSSMTTIDECIFKNNLNHIYIPTDDCVVNNSILDMTLDGDGGANIHVYTSTNFTVTNNVFLGSSSYSISIFHVHGIGRIENNTFQNATYDGIYAVNTKIASSSGSLFIQNNVFTGFFGKATIKFIDAEIDQVFVRYNQFYDITGVDSGVVYFNHDNGDVYVSYNTVSNCNKWFWYSPMLSDGHYYLHHNNITNSNGGFYTHINSKGLTIYSNRIINNAPYGIEIHEDVVGDILIYDNYLDNEFNVYDQTAGKVNWSISKTPCKNIVGGPYQGGNYYTDYTGIDADGDYIGDTPYLIPGGSNQDTLPLINFLGDSSFFIYVDDDADPGWYDETHVQTITEGVNNVCSGGTIFVFPGTYNEEINIDKSISLIGSGYTTTTIVGSDAWGNVVEVSHDWVNITGFSVTSDADYMKGIRTGSNDNIRISECSFYDIDFYGVLENGENNNIINSLFCSVGGTYPGIELGSSSNNAHVEGCEFTGTHGIYVKGENALIDECDFETDDNGIYFYNSGHTTLDNCYFKVTENIDRVGLYILSSDVTTINNCHFEDGVSHIMFRGSSILNISHSLFDGAKSVAITSLNSNNMSVDNCTITFSEDTPLYLDSYDIDMAIPASAISVLRAETMPPASYFYFTNNTIQNNLGVAFSIINENHVYIHGNNISDNVYAFNISDSHDVYIYDNNIAPPADTYIQYYENNTDIYFNISKTRGTNIINGPYLGGNYWSDYNGSDSDGDGIGDTVHIFEYALESVQNMGDGVDTSGMYSDGTYLYRVTDISVEAYSMSDSGLTLLDTYEEAFMEGGLSGDGTYIYATTWELGLIALEFDGEDFSLLKSLREDEIIEYISVTYDYGYIYTTEYWEQDDVLFYNISVYDFDGSDFTLIDRLTISDEDGAEFEDYGMDADDGIVYVCGHENSIATCYAYSFDGANLSYLDKMLFYPRGTGTLTEVQFYNGYIYVVGLISDDGGWDYSPYIAVLIIDDTGFSMIDEIYELPDDDTYDAYDGLYVDDRYIYAVGASAGDTYCFIDVYELIDDSLSPVYKHLDDYGEDSRFSKVYANPDNSQLYITGYKAIGEDEFNLFIYDFTAFVDYLPLAELGGLNADFYYMPNNPSPNQNIYFYDQSTGSPDSWHWDFGDGSIAVGKNQNHKYTDEGIYRVTLKISVGGSFFDSLTKTVCVEEETTEYPYIPPVKPPNYPIGYTMDEIYRVVNGDQLEKNNNKIKIIVMDSGVYPRMYENTSLLNIQRMYHPIYNDGVDYYGHGTLVNYEIAYLLQSLLPNAEQISYKAFDTIGGSTSDVFIESLDAIKKLNPDIVSISAGAFGDPDDVFSRKIKELRDQGIIVIASAGNYGPTVSSITSPACSGSALAIGASDPVMTVDNLNDDIICSWSSRGPVSGVDEYKPDIVAPGESIRGPWLNYEKVASGTSLSAPVVSGGTAVVVAEHKTMIDLVKTLWFWNKGVVPDAYEDALEQSCISKGDQYSWGAGIVQFDQVSNVFFWNLFWLLMYPIIFISLVIIIIVLYIKRDKIREYFFP